MTACQARYPGFLAADCLDMLISNGPPGPCSSQVNFNLLHRNMFCFSSYLCGASTFEPDRGKWPRHRAASDSCPIPGVVVTPTFREIGRYPPYFPKYGQSGPIESQILTITHSLAHSFRSRLSKLLLNFLNTLSRLQLWHAAFS